MLQPDCRNALRSKETSSASEEWVPLSGPLPEMAFEADERIIERRQKTKLKEGLPVDPDFTC